MDQSRLNHLSDVIENEIKKGGLSGASVYVEADGKEEFRRHYGSDREKQIYRIFSMTKPITSAAAFILYERGLLDLMAPVSEYLPCFSDSKVLNRYGQLDRAYRAVTVKDLLNMTSGIVYPGTGDAAERTMKKNIEQLVTRRKCGKKITADDIGKAIAQTPLAFQPGSQWRYGASADILGLVIAAIAGCSLGEFMSKELFDPLEMSDTGFSVDSSNQKRIAPFYMFNEEGKPVPISGEKAEELQTSLFLFEADGKPVFESGGAGLYASGKDYIHFMQMLRDGGAYQGHRILGRKTVEFMRQNQLTPEQKKWIGFDSIIGYGYGNLMRSMEDLEQAASNGSVSEFGWDGLPGCYMMIDPEEKLIFLYMQQQLEGANLSLRRRMRQIVYSACE